MFLKTFVRLIMTKRGSSSMQDRFRGCLIGAVLGDCLGSPFEFLGSKYIPRSNILSKVGPTSDIIKEKSKGSLHYTDDTAMARSVCESFIAHKGFNASDMADRFTKSYYKEPGRGYGSGVVSIFEQWDKCGTEENVYKPGRDQFAGSGSYGNGAAMRVAPVALVAKDQEDVIELAKKTALLTHSHKHGYTGAILQALAVYAALNSDHPLDKRKYIHSLGATMAELEEIDAEDIKSQKGDETEKREKNKVRWSRRDTFSFTKQLTIIEELLETPPSDSDVKQITERLGNDISAQEAVPAAVYSFVRNSDKDLEEVTLYAISLGGDTDTIGTMAAAIGGAYFGASKVPTEWKRVCEGVDDAMNYADELFKIFHNDEER